MWLNVSNYCNGFDAQSAGVRVFDSMTNRNIIINFFLCVCMNCYFFFFHFVVKCYLMICVALLPKETVSLVWPDKLCWRYQENGIHRNRLLVSKVYTPLFNERSTYRVFCLQGNSFQPVTMQHIPSWYMFVCLTFALQGVEIYLLETFQTDYPKRAMTITLLHVW